MNNGAPIEFDNFLRIHNRSVVCHPYIGGSCADDISPAGATSPQRLHISSVMVRGHFGAGAVVIVATQSRPAAHVAH